MTPSGELVDLGTEVLPKVRDKNDLGTRQLALYRLLNRLLDRFPKVNTVAMESPLAMGNLSAWNQRSGIKTSPHTIRLQHTLAATIELGARLRGIRPLEVAVISAKAALAHARAKKPDMIAAACKRYGLDSCTEHEADAIGVCLVVLGRG